MDRKIKLMAFIVAFACISMLVGAQPGPQGGPGERPDGPGMQQGNEPGDGPMGGPGRPGMQGKGMKPDPEKMQRNNALMTMAEAHKGLSKLYEDQNKLDEAAAELYKIIELARGEMQKSGDDPFFQRNIMGKVMPVYHHISQLYLKNNRAADAEKLLLEGITLFEKDFPAEASKLTLALAELYKNNNDTKKAEETFKRIIEQGQKNLK